MKVHPPLKTQAHSNENLRAGLIAGAAAIASLLGGCNDSPWHAQLSGVPLFPEQTTNEFPKGNGNDSLKGDETPSRDPIMYHTSGVPPRPAIEKPLPPPLPEKPRD